MEVLSGANFTRIALQRFKMSPQDIRKGRLYCLTTAPITKGRTNELFKVKIQVELIL